MAAAPTLSGCRLPTLRCGPRQSVVASGLTNPRGLAIGPDGQIYVAEVGTKESGGSISRLTDRGGKNALLTGLPYFVDAIDEEVGTEGVAIRQGSIYVLQGESPGDLGSALLLLKGGRAEKIADFNRFEDRYNPDNGDRESNPVSMLYDDSADVFYVVDSAANDLLRVHPDGKIDLVGVWKTGHPVPTGFARGHDGAFYVAMFSPAPYDAGTGRVDRVDLDGHITTVVSNLTTPIDVAFGADGALHVLQFTSGYQKYRPVGFVPQSGRLMRIADGQPETVVDGLSFPTNVMTLSDGAMLVSNYGALSEPKRGTIIRVERCR